MKETALVIMAAGIGSRFGGGIKQLAPVGPNGEIIMDYSIHDAIEAGFNKVVFIIRKDLEKDFKEIIGDRIAKQIPVIYAYQEPVSYTHLKKAMAEVYSRMSTAWYAGKGYEAVKGAVEEPGFKMWQEFCYPAVLYEYLEYMTADSVRDYNKLQSE